MVLLQRIETFWIRASPSRERVRLLRSPMLPEIKLANIQVERVIICTIDDNVTFTRVGVSKNDGDTSLACHCLDRRVCPVVSDRSNDAAVVGHFSLDAIERHDEVGKVSSYRAPAHRECAVITTTIRASVWVVLFLSSVVTEHRCPLLGSWKRKDARVLEENGRLRCTAADSAEMVHADVDVLVDETIAGLRVIVLVSISVALPADKVHRAGLIKTDVVVRAMIRTAVSSRHHCGCQMK